MFTKAACILGAWVPFAVCSAGLYESQQSGGHHRLHRNMTSPHWCVGSAPGALWKKLICLFFEDLQRRADERTMTTALGPDILSFMQSAARWSPGHWAWWWVCPPPLPRCCSSAGSPPGQPAGAAAVACSFLILFLRTGWRQ